jgi:hypothetical protein
MEILREGKRQKVKGKIKKITFSSSLLPFAFLILPCFPFHFANQNRTLPKILCETNPKPRKKRISNQS